MRIGIITGEYPPLEGGVGAYTQILARALADAGHDVFIFTSAQAQEADSRLHLSAVMHKWGIGSLGKIRQWAAENHLDVVSVQYQTAAFAMSPWIHFIPDVLRMTPVVTTFHDLRFPYLFPKAGRIRNGIVMHLARGSRGAIVTNTEDLQRLNTLPNVTLIPIGSNILQPPPADGEAAALRARMGASADDFLIAFFGLINHSKGLDVLLHALSLLRQRGTPTRLVIVGGSPGSSDPTNAAYLKDIQSQIERLSLTPYVHFTGFVSEADVAAWLVASDATALPFRDGASYRRGSLMAALHYGCAIITTTPAVEVAAFEHGHNMLLVPLDDASALEAALEQLYQSPELRSTLRQGAAQLARQFEWPTIAAETAAFFARASAHVSGAST